eukprot:5333348-Pyramimonas_sp.AAC.1
MDSIFLNNVQAWQSLWIEGLVQSPNGTILIHEIFRLIDAIMYCSTLGSPHDPLEAGLEARQHRRGHLARAAQNPPPLRPGGITPIK